MALFYIPLVLSLVLADVAGTAPAVGGTTLQVPYLPQTEALCGGAAAAMLFRYWGERHADVQQFEPLVDHRAGGIADTVLENAIRERSWITTRLAGSVAAIHAHLAAGQPLMLLIEDRPQRYHYVIAVAADGEAVYVHDPAWGPSRRLTLAQLERAWRATDYWTLLVVPGPDRPPPDVPVAAGVPPPTTAGNEAPPSDCDRLMDAALDELATAGLDAADRVLGAVGNRCPDWSRPLSELAGIRFSQHRPAEAAALAEQAVARNPADAYAWDVLGSSRFVDNDLHGALEAWNQVTKPVLDAVRIDGLSRTRYALVAQVLPLTPNTTLTRAEYTRAERRLQQLPDRLSSRIGYRPEADGYATVDITLLERPSRPRGMVQWVTTGAKTLIDRELSVIVPGGTGQGEVWSGSWRWWHDRPRVSFGFAAPRVGRLPGVWQVEGSWEAQTYAVNDGAVRDTRTHAGAGLGDWLTANLRYQVMAGLDGWDGSDRAASLGATLEQRLFDDHVGVTATATNWASVSGGPSFRTGVLELRWRSSREPAGFVALGQVRLEAASAGAPRALWPGAGEGRARVGLLRAHPLLQDNVVAGPVFGRRAYVINGEAQRWFEPTALIRVAGALFVDAAGAAARLPGSRGRGSQIDAGAGVRLSLPGGEGTLRVDYARGLRDGSDAVTLGWQIPF